jgi:hypothetical protein
MDSRPPPTPIRSPSWAISFATVAIAMRPEAHCRSMLMPATLDGRPARSADCRPMLNPVEPCCSAAPITTSSTSPGSTWARATA